MSADKLIEDVGDILFSAFDDTYQNEKCFPEWGQLSECEKLPYVCVAKEIIAATGVVEMREALREATEWNWLDDDMPEHVVKRCEDTLSNTHEPEKVPIDVT